MKRHDVLSMLMEHREVLQQRFGVKSLAVFGSVARDEATEASDVDLLVEFDRPIGLLHLIGTQQYLEKLLGVYKVDLVLRHAVIAELQEDIYGEAVDVIPAQKVEVSRAAHTGSD